MTEDRDVSSDEFLPTNPTRLGWVSFDSRKADKPAEIETRGRVKKKGWGDSDRNNNNDTCVSKCSLYVFTIIPPRLTDQCNFITVL